MTLGVSDVPGLMDGESWCQAVGEAGGYNSGSATLHPCHSAGASARDK